MPQTIIEDVGGEIETTFLAARPASCTVTLKTSSGTVKIDGETATVDSVSTTVSSAVAAGATTVALASATSVVSGRRYMLGLQGSTAPQEVVTAKSLSASTVTLFHPTVYAHASGDAFRCGRVTYTVPSGSADVTWFDGYAVFTPNTGDPVTEVVECALRKIPEDLIDKPDCLQVFPKGIEMLDSELDWPKGLREARDLFLSMVGGKVRTMTMIGNEDFKYGAALTFWLMRRFAFGDAWRETMNDMETERNRIIGKLQSMVPVDADQDGTTDGAGDGGMTSGIVERA